MIDGAETSQHRELMDQVYRLRHRVFVEELGWRELTAPDGREQDQFDHDGAVHHLCVHAGKVVGYQRMLPTTRPHLLTDVMPELCEGDPPSGPGIYEWTRNCVAPEWRDSSTGVPTVSLKLTLAVVEWGLARQLDAITVEFDPIFLLRALQMQFLVRPLGYQRIIAGKPAIAARLAFTAATAATIRRAWGSQEARFAAPPRHEAPMPERMAR